MPPEEKPKRTHQPHWQDNTSANRQAEIQKRYKIIYSRVMEQAVALGYPRTAQGIQDFMAALEAGEVEIVVKRP